MMNPTTTLRTLAAALTMAGALSLPAHAQTPPAASGPAAQMPGHGPGMGNPAMMQQRMQAHMAAGGQPGMMQRQHQGHAGHPAMHGGHGHEGGMKGRMGMRMLDQVGATPEQKGNIVRITETLKAEMKPQREAGKAMREKMKDLLAQPTIDTAAVEALRQQMAAHHDQASKRRMQTMLEVAKVLTPEQRAKLAELRKSHGQHPHGQPMQGQRRVIIERIERGAAPAPR